MPTRSILGRLLALALALGAQTAAAADLRVGTQNIPVLDPHFMLQDSNIAYNQHIYGALINFDEHGKMLPDLATSWTSDGKRTWRFNLRQGVTFHDGSPLTADDVVFSFKRVPAVPNNPAPYTGQLLGVEDVRKVDDHTVDIVTEDYMPLLPPQIAKLAIVSKRAAEGKGTEDFNTGKAAIGTGPYRVVSVQGKDKVFLERFDQYWGKRPDWAHVEFRVLPNDGSRVAALLAGDVDLIEFVPLQDAARLKTMPGIAVHSGDSARVMYLGANLDPKAVGPDGKNQMLDPRVRLAVSLAMNRDGLVRSTLQG